MGLADKVIKRLEQQADTIAQYRQLDDRRRSQITELERELQRLRQRHVEVQSEELAAAQAEIETLRQQLDAAQAGADNLRKDRDHWKQARQDAHEAGELMQAEIETLQGAMSADDKRLRDAEEKVWPGATFGCDAAEKMADEILYLRQQLANAQQELSEQGQVHSVEGWQEAADLREQLNAAQAALTRERLNAEERGQELERLREFVKVMRGLLTEEYADQRIIAAALAELDAGTTQPAPCPECETLRREIEEAYASGFRSMATALAEHKSATTEPAPVTEPLDPDTRGQEPERLRAFVAKAREPRQRRRDETDFQSIPSAYCNRALDELDAANPAPVAEPLGAEGGA